MPAHQNKIKHNATWYPRLMETEIPLDPGSRYETVTEKRDRFVRLSLDDFNLLDSLPGSGEGVLDAFLEHAAKSKLTGVKPGVTASTEEIAAVLNALQAHINDPTVSDAEKTHAQDMYAFWEHTYMPVEKPAGTPFPDYQLDEPRPKGNIHFFAPGIPPREVQYNGERYVLAGDLDDEPQKFSYSDPAPKRTYLKDRPMDLVENPSLEKFKKTMEGFDELSPSEQLEQLREFLADVPEARLQIPSVVALNSERKTLSIIFDGLANLTGETHRLVQDMVIKMKNAILNKGFSEYGGRNRPVTLDRVFENPTLYLQMLPLIKEALVTWANNTPKIVGGAKALEEFAALLADQVLPHNIYSPSALSSLSDQYADAYLRNNRFDPEVLKTVHDTSLEVEESIRDILSMWKSGKKGGGDEGGEGGRSASVNRRMVASMMQRKRK